MAIFDRLDRMASRQVDRAFSRKAIIQPMGRTANGRPQYDNSRPQLTITGIFDQAASYDAIEVGERTRGSNDFRTLSAGHEFQFSFDLVKYPYAGQIRQATC